MNIFIVEDNINEVSAYLQVLSYKGHTWQRAATFAEAYMAIADEKKNIDVFLIDLLIPWGSGISEQIVAKSSHMRAGLYLIYAIRNIKNAELEEIRSESALPRKLPHDFR